MNSLREEILSAYRNNDQKNIPICSVCQDTFTKIQFTSDIRTDKVHQIVCGHLFHTNCITSAFAHKPQCPICRHEIVDLAPHKDWENFRKSILETITTSKDQESGEEIGGIDVKPSPFRQQNPELELNSFLQSFISHSIETQLFDSIEREIDREINFSAIFTPDPQLQIRDFSHVFREFIPEPEPEPSLLDCVISVIDEARSQISNLFFSIFS